jgi:hypothetical protein
MDELIKTELFKNIDGLLNELELTMDYLDKQIISNIRKYIKKVKNNQEEFNEFITYTTKHLGSYESKISAILFSDKKIKSSFYNFLSEVSLFNNLLQFKIFENESKNTKKELIKYLYVIYMSTSFLNFKLSNDESNPDELTKQLEEFICKIKTEADTTLKDEDIKTNKNKKDTNLNNTKDIWLDNNDTSQSMNNIMDSILNNKEIFNIATDISNKLNERQLNPMTMLSSLMSGNIENSPLQGLVEEIQQTVENKINSGQIDKSQLTNQANNIINSISQNQSHLNAIPGMSNIINNMMKDTNNHKN